MIHRTLLALLGCLAMVATARANTWSDLWLTREQQAQRLLDSNQPAAAAALSRDPRRQAYADLRAGQYDKAAQLLAPFKDADSQYNRGNALAHTGQLREALQAYDAALAASPGNRDVIRNRDLVKRALEQQERQAQQQSGNGQSTKGQSGRGQGDSNGARPGQGGQPDRTGDQQSSSGSQSQAAQGSNSQRPGDSAQSGQQGGAQQGSPSQAANQGAGSNPSQSGAAQGGAQSPSPSQAGNQGPGNQPQPGNQGPNNQAQANNQGQQRTPTQGSNPSQSGAAQGTAQAPSPNPSQAGAARGSGQPQSPSPSQAGNQGPGNQPQPGNTGQAGAQSQGSQAQNQAGGGQSQNAGQPQGAGQSPGGSQSGASQSADTQSNGSTAPAQSRANPSGNLGQGNAQSTAPTSPLDANTARNDAAAALRYQQNQQGHGQSGQPPNAVGLADSRSGTRQPSEAAPPQPPSEQSLALDQWLRGIPEDSGELLQRKFLIEHIMRQQGHQP